MNVVGRNRNRKKIMVFEMSVYSDLYTKQSNRPFTPPGVCCPRLVNVKTNNRRTLLLILRCSNNTRKWIINGHVMKNTSRALNLPLYPSFHQRFINPNS